MNKSTWNTIILFWAIALFFWAIVFWLYDRDSNNLQNKEYSSDCEYTLSGDIFTINAICIQENRLPKMNLVDIIDNVWDQIKWFSGYYEPFSESFNYYWATPIFSNELNPYLSKNNYNLLENPIKNREKISFSKKDLARYYAENISYFVADKDLINLWNCTRTNYDLALESMNNFILKPWESLNINQKLGSIKDYCKWKIEEEHLFYGWVCGMVSQLFRVSLVNPDIVITKRFSHNEWFVQYYGETVWWDDAAIYERSKQFEILNSGNSDIIFKVREEWNNSELIAISWPTNKWVNISKSFINWRQLAIHLDKTIYQSTELWNSGNIERVESFDSYYAGKTYETR